MLQLKKVSELSDMILPKRSNNLSSEDAPIAAAEVAVEDDTFIMIVDASNGAIIEDEEVLATLPYPY